MFERLCNFFFDLFTPTSASKVQEGPWKFEDLEDEFQTCKITAPNGNVVYAKYFTKEQVRRLQAPIMTEQPVRPCEPPSPPKGRV